MKLRTKIMLLLPLIGVTACGYGLKDAVYGNRYNSPVFKENYYSNWDAKLKAAKDNNEHVTILDKEENKVFTSYGDHNFVDKVDPGRARSLKYFNFSYIDGDYYGNHSRVDLQDETFKYGYISKLFDGRMFCGGKYQLSRVQIDESGFATSFKKEMSASGEGVPYFAINFKASSDYTTSENVPSHLSAINFKLTLFTKGNDTISANTYTYQLNEVATNASDYCNEPTIDNIYELKSNYVFYGFSLEGLNFERCVGMAITYDLISDPYSKRSENPLDHSLMLYEVFFENVIWK